MEKNIGKVLLSSLVSLLKLIISLLLLTYLFLNINLNEVFIIISNANFYYLILSIMLFMFCVFINASKWRLLLSSKSEEIALKKAVSLYFVGMFINTFLPGTIGGDGLRIYELSKYNNSKKVDVVSSVVVERLTGLFALSIIAVIAIIFGFNKIRNIEGISIVIISLFFTFGIFISLFNSNIFKKVQQILSRIFQFDRFNLISKLNKVYTSVHQYRTDKSALMMAIFLSIAFQIIVIINMYIISLALGLQIDIFYFFIFVPIITFIITIPISIQGLGVREVAFVFFYTQVGATVPQAMSFSITVYLLRLFVNSIGGFIYGARNIREIYS